MTTRLSAGPDFGHKTFPAQRNTHLKRKAWMAVFAGSALFWLAAAFAIWYLWG